MSSSDGDATLDAWDPETARMLREVFAQEATEHIDALATHLMNLVDDPEELSELLRRAHTLKGSAGSVGFDRMEQAAHRLEEQFVLIREQKLTVNEDVVDGLLSACDMLMPLVEAETREDAQVTLDALAKLLDSLGRDPKRRRKYTSRVRRETTQRIELNPPIEDNRTQPDRRREDLNQIRVDVQRIDELMNRVGQLIIDRTQLERRIGALRALAGDLTLTRDRFAEDNAVTRSQELTTEFSSSLARFENELEALVGDSRGIKATTRGIQEQLNRIRMIRMAWAFGRLQRPVRELARDQGKEVELVTRGDAAEMDRSIIDELVDPLIQLVRNAVAHGIETSDQRERQGKARVGRVLVSARQRNNMMVIEVEDDGAGVDHAEVRRTLARLDHAPADLDQVDDQALLDYMFLPGFTTRKAVDQGAGRGVGLDIVKRNIVRMGGSIRVTTERGKGTCFVVELPMRMPITQALLFKQGDGVYALPVAHLAGHLEVDRASLRQDDGWQVRVSIGWIPLIDLGALFGERRALGERLSAAGSTTPIVVVKFGERQFGLSCERVIGLREIVLKRLGPLLSQFPLFAGATVSGSGKVQFVLDVAALDRAASEGISTISRGVAQASRSGRVLVVDDSRTIRKALTTMLQREGFRVDVAEDGEAAWQRLRAGEDYQLMVTDLEMPRLTGFDLIARCRAHTRLSELPVVVLTSRTGDSQARQAELLGVLAFMAKPLDAKLLRKAVDKLKS